MTNRTPRPAPAKPQKVQEVRAWRRWLVLGFLVCGMLGVFGRAFQLQVVERDFLAREGAKRHIRTVELEGHRGAIRDRRGEPLALSAPVDSIWTVPSALLAAPEYVLATAGVLNLKPRELQRFLQEREDKKFVYLKRHINPEEAQRVLALNAPGVFAQREYRRYYPAGEVSGQVVGFTDLDGRGQEGMEAARNTLLTGIPGSRRVIRDGKGRIVEDTQDIKLAQAGEDLQLTLDLRLQYLAYRELKSAVGKHHAKGGLVLLADAQSGEILAIASQPGYNPNNPDDRKSGGLRNRAIVDSFEPGSTIKPLLIAQALEIGTIKADYHVDTGPGYFKVGALTVRDVHPNGDMDLGLILAKSSNVGAAKIGLEMGAESVWSGYQKFGLGEKVGAGFPGEAAPVLRAPGSWGQIATATASYGYGLSLNALQLVRAYTALANDGLMSQLKLVRDGKTTPPQRAISAATARKVRLLMESVVSKEGSGLRAAVPGYRVAGKTGTARKTADTGGYASDRHQSLFIGMVPAERPRLICLVMIDEPAAGAYYGGVVAAPVFSTVMQGALRLLQIPPDEPRPLVLPPRPKTQTVSLPIKPPT